MIYDDAMSLALFVIRFAVGAVMIAHGYNHIFGGGKIAGTAGWFESLGMRPGALHAWTASIVELVAGVMLILGLAVPLAGAAVVGIMLVAWITNHRSNGFFIFRPGEGYEYVMVLTLAGAAFGGLGGGRWSLDNVFGWFTPPGWVGLLLSAGLGTVSAIALLAIFWRPAVRVSASTL